MAIQHVGKMTIAGHRGDSYNYYENTMTAFRAAVAAGADMIETDVHMTKDDVLILIHDHTVDRTTDGSGNTAEMTWAQIAQLNAGDAFYPEAVPTFEAFMAWVTDEKISINIEIKEYYSPENEARCARCIDQIIETVEKYNMRDRTILNSFDAWVLEYIYQKHGKKYMLHGFYPYETMKNVRINPEEYLYCACIWGKYEKEKFDYLIERGIEPWVGSAVTQPKKFELCVKYGAKLATVNNPKDAIEKLIALGYRKG